jgi:MinD superfamily P-loop ATPase
VCAFNALLCLKEDVLVFPELCKGCRGCVALCPEGAIREGKKMIGVVETREQGRLRTITGRIRIGETAVPDLIREVKRSTGPEDDLVIMDAPPGTACAAVEAVRGADYSILIAESTPFGLHDLELMVQTMRLLEQPFGVVINKSVPHDASVRSFCAREHIDVLGVIPASSEIARACARGAIVAEAVPETAPVFRGILDAVLRREEVTA